MTATLQADRKRELLPCPFCGSSKIEGPRPEHIERAAGYGYTVYNVGHTNLSSGGMKCIAWVTAESKEEAIERWNRRSPPSLPDGLEELRAKAEEATQEKWSMIYLGGSIGLRVKSGYQAFFALQRPHPSLEVEVRANAAFIEACSPPAILSMLNALEAALAAAPPLPVQTTKEKP